MGISEFSSVFSSQFFEKLSKIVTLLKALYIYKTQFFE